MHRSYPVHLLALILIPALLFSGCVDSAREASIEEVLQLSNDILEDPLLKELDALETALMNQDLEPSAVPVETLQEPATTPPPSTAQTQEPTPKLPPPSTAPADVPTPSEATAPVPQKRVLFGVVNRVSGSGIVLRVIQAKTLTPEEQAQVNNGEIQLRTLLTDELVPLDFGRSFEVERLENRLPVSASLSDVTRGQTVRVALDSSGMIKLLRIIRN